MKFLRIFIIVSMAILLASPAARAGDFAWTRNFNLQAKADPLEFRAKLAERFDLTEVQVIALRNIFASPADAYIMLRLGEMQGDLKAISREQGIEAVKKYRSNKDKGWEVLAEILGIETESEQFLALKRDHDMYTEMDHDRVASRGYEPEKDSFIK